MKQIKKYSIIVASIFLMLCAYNVNASVVWQLNDFQFDDGTSATGSFTWDEVANTATSWDILTIDGFRHGTQYSSSTGIFFTISSSTSLHFNEDLNNFRIGLADLNLLDTPSASLNLFSQNIGQTGINGFIECTNCGSVRYGEAGAFLSASVVPVPAAVWLFGSGLIGLIGIGSRRKI